jgi:hypothetical protein
MIISSPGDLTSQEREHGLGGVQVLHRYRNASMIISFPGDLASQEREHTALAECGYYTG